MAVGVFQPVAKVLQVMGAPEVQVGEVGLAASNAAP